MPGAAQGGQTQHRDPSASLQCWAGDGLPTPPRWPSLYRRVKLRCRSMCRRVVRVACSLLLKQDPQKCLSCRAQQVDQ